MISLVLCVVAFVSAYFAGRKSLVAGLGVTMAVGYSYGIVRANFLGGFTHFFFDCALVGLYVAQFTRPAVVGEQRRLKTLFAWLAIATIWPILVTLVPAQPYLVGIVGLRGNIFFIFVLILGARMNSNDRIGFATWLAGLNVLAFGFAVAEYVLGVPAFYPQNEVTSIIYNSKDVAGYEAYRIPATFTSAHAYAGALASTIPLLLGAWLQPSAKPSQKWLIIAGLATAMIGVMMAATRLHFVVAATLVLVASFGVKMRPAYRLSWLTALAIVGYFVAGDERMQRFSTLADTDMVSERIGGSVNKNFLDLVTTYPMGNGMGGGGTSMPFFLASQVHNPVGLENEYSRLLLEQGIVGLGLWIAFMGWILTRPSMVENDSWKPGRTLARLSCFMNFATGVIGIGMFTSVPQTFLLFANAGWLVGGDGADLEEEADDETDEDEVIDDDTEQEPNYA